jgi:hypothetical protein
MADSADFIKRLENKIRQQLTSQRVGFLLGAGSSYLDGKGYPLTAELWILIRDSIPPKERNAIQTKLDGGASGLEQALDLLDGGGVTDSPHRHSVTAAISGHFAELTPPLDSHAAFLQKISRRTEPSVPIFSLNYDPLLERAAEYAKVRLIDGFVGWEHAYFDPAVFQQDIVVIRRGPRSRQYGLVSGIIRLMKLHGSLGWYESSSNGVRRCGYNAAIPVGTKRLMIPPQYRKATDTMTLPYAALWSEFRGLLRHGPYVINRLASIGYGMRDEHVNAVIENGLARKDLTLLILTRDLTPDVFSRWSSKANVIIVTKDRCSLYGEIGPGHFDLWSFERLSREV